MTKRLFGDLKSQIGGASMENVTQINENIYRLTIPYKDIFTTVYAVKTESGALLFDCASYDEDIENAKKEYRLIRN